MTRDPQIDELLSQLPRQDRDKVVNFLRGLTHKHSARQTKKRRVGTGRSVAERSFGMIPADAATVRQVVSEDLYDLE